MAEQYIEFLGKKDFILREELGQGACGRTVLLYDPTIDEHFVCKKFAPSGLANTEELFANFVREVKLLHLANHPNVVRIFNYYLYPDSLDGYIVMEYVHGDDITAYLTTHPEDINEIFAQLVDGFAYLERTKILHRDIRPTNILVNSLGAVKIIDFGFGKQINNAADFDKSVTLNWWCEPPDEFSTGTYDHGTDVYFVGKLIKKILDEQNITQFKHPELLARMCSISQSDRIGSFSLVRKELLTDQFLDIDFDKTELKIYREFSDGVLELLSSIEQSATYKDDALEVQHLLEACYKSVMLEEYVPSANTLLKCFISGTYSYYTNKYIEVSILHRFLDWYRRVSREK